MSGASSMGSGGNRGDGNCPGLVERACRSIVAADDGYDGAHVFAGDHSVRRYGPGETSEDILERRASVRSLIASVLLVVALLLMGFLLLGVDSAQRRQGERERGDVSPGTPEPTDNGCYFVSLDASSVVDSPMVYQER